MKTGANRHQLESTLTSKIAVNATSHIADYRNLPVTVMGLGRFGGGLGAVKFLLDRGARVTVTDLRPEAQLAETLKEFDASQLVRLHCGGHVDADFAEAQLLVVNPAVKPNCPWLAKARERGISLTSEMNLFWQHNRGRVIGVTGSNGKSTTTALVAHLLRTAGRVVHLGGNIGGSLLPLVDKIEPTDWVVLELSSFQLADLDRIEASPEIAVVTNFAPNHLDWHLDLDDYRRAKQTILRWQTMDSTAVLNADDADVREWATRGRVWLFGRPSGPLAPAGDEADSNNILAGGEGDHAQLLPLHPGPLPPSGVGSESSTDRGGEGAEAVGHVSYVPDKETRSVGFRPRLSTVDQPAWAKAHATNADLLDLFPLPGEHNRMNAAAAISAVLAAGVERQTLAEGLRTFRGLPHRLEFVGEVAGRRFYNDSLATTPESAICALKAFPGRVLLLAGGYDKQVDLSEFAHEAAKRATVIAWMGQTGETLEALASQVSGQALAAGSSPGDPQNRRQAPCRSLNQARRVTTNLREAFTWLWEQSQPGDTILLSPACASFDWFLNFADRGEQFRGLVRETGKG